MRFPRKIKDGTSELSRTLFVFPKNNLFYEIIERTNQATKINFSFLAFQDLPRSYFHGSMAPNIRRGKTQPFPPFHFILPVDSIEKNVHEKIA